MLANTKRAFFLLSEHVKFKNKKGAIMGNDNVGELGYLRLPDVLKLFPVSRSTFLAGVKEKKYPQGVKLSKRCVAWKRADIIKLCEGE
jgi:prophage regulatory protein